MTNDKTELPISFWLDQQGLGLHRVIEIGVLHKILFPVYESTSLGGFLPCLTVCRAFYTTAVRFFYQAVTLVGAGSLSRFLNAFRSDPPILRAVTVLTVELDVSEQEPLSDSIFAFLLGLATLLRGNMQYISSLSIRFEDQLHEYPGLHAGCLPQTSAKLIIALLEALPSSCADLEGDTSGFERYADIDEHLCPTIKRLMPQLRHLRVRIQRACSMVLGIDDVNSDANFPGELLPPIYPFLRSVVISLELWSKIPGGTRNCNHETEGDTCFDALMRPFRRLNFITETHLPLGRMERLDI